ncbi:MAG: tetratricopeptide repeat protein [Pseudomonadota bacterium]
MSSRENQQRWHLRTSLSSLGNWHQAKGDYDSAEQFFKRALEICQKVLGAEHPNTVTFRNNLERCRAEMFWK